MAQKSAKTMNPGLIIKLKNDGLLCCQSSYMLEKYADKGHLIISSRVRVLD